MTSTEPTIYVISVGRSLWDNLSTMQKFPEEIRHDPHLRSVFRDAAEKEGAVHGAGAHAPDEAAAWLGAALNQGETAEAEELRQTCEELRPERWPDSVSAEVSTLRAVRPPGTASLLGERDTVLLIASDNAAILRAGMWNALAMVRGRADRVRYLDSPSADLEEFAGRAIVARIPGLDAVNDEGFHTPMGALGTIGRGLRRIADRENARFHFLLSGGFKAAIPYLIGLAEGLRGTSAARVEASVLHDSNPERAIRLPLRTLPAEAVRRELAGARDGYLPKDPEPAYLLGYAYEADAEGLFRLTAFGAGLRALVGLPEEV